MFPKGIDLQHLIEVESTRNLSRAAERLGISQPSLTLSIQKLEKAVGTQLLIRKKTGVLLTPAGQRVATGARGLLSAWSQIRSDALGDHEKIQGQFTLGCHPAVARYTLAEFLPNLLRDYPELRFTLLHDLSRKILERVVSHQIDLGIVVNPIAHPDLVRRTLCYDAIGLWEARSGRVSQALFCDPELSQVQVLLPRLQKQGMAFSQIIASSSLEVIAALVKRGAGYGLLPERVALLEGDDKLCKVNSRLPQHRDQICLVFRSDSLRTAAVKRVISEIQERVKF